MNITKLLAEIRRTEGIRLIVLSTDAYDDLRQRPDWKTIFDPRAEEVGRSTLFGHQYVVDTYATRPFEVWSRPVPYE